MSHAHKPNQLTNTQRLQLFLRRADELKQTNLAQGPVSIDLEVHFRQEGDSSISLSQPDEDLLRSFLLTFRQLISNDEPIHVNTIYNICQKHCTDPDLSDLFKASRGKWKEALSTTAFRLEINGQQLTPPTILDTWINGHYFHNDLAKQRLLDTLDPLGTAVAKQTFLLSVFTAARELGNLATLVRRGLTQGSITD